MAFDLGSIIKAVAPTIATALGGPLAGAAVSFLAGKFGTESTQEAVQKAVEGFTAADTVKLKQLDLEFQEHMADLGIKIQLANLAVDVEEAKSESVFVAGWRPFVGWVCGFGLAYAAVILPALEFTAKVGFGYKGPFPVMDSLLLMQVLGTLLGMAGIRSYDKAKGNKSGMSG